MQEECYLPESKVLTVKFGSRGIMGCGYFSELELGSLVPMKCIVNGKEYKIFTQLFVSNCPQDFNSSEISKH